MSCVIRQARMIDVTIVCLRNSHDHDAFFIFVVIVFFFKLMFVAYAG